MKEITFPKPKSDMEKDRVNPSKDMAEVKIFDYLDKYLVL